MSFTLRCSLPYMGRLIYGFNVSVDGYIVDAQGHIWRDMHKVVFSHTLESVDWNSRLERGNPVEVVAKLKAETGGRLEVAGATLAAPIVQAGLVDEYRIVVAPSAVGGGTPFFPTLPSWISLRLLENRTFPGGMVLLRYEAKRG